MTEQVQFVDQVSALGFVQLPVAVLRDSRLSDGALRTYATLVSFARQEQRCWPGLDRIARDRGKSPRRITAHLQELRRVGLVSTTRRVGTSQVYWIIPMWNVYGRADEPHRFTEEAIAVCSLDDDGRIPKRKDVKVSKEVPSEPPPPVDMGTVALVVGAASQRTEEARAARGAKEATRQAAKADKRAAKVERETGLTGEKFRLRWMELYREKWPNLPMPTWGKAERSLAKRIVTNYPELALEVCERVIEYWEDYARRWSLDGVPTIKLVWGYREGLFAEAAQGLPPGGSKGEALRADEFQDDGGSLGKVGW